MTNTLLPTFPAMRLKVATGQGVAVKFLGAWRYDDELGDYPLDGAGNTIRVTGLEAAEDWAMGALMTERGVSPIYPRDFGIEWRTIPRLANRAVAEATARRWIREALTVDRRFVDVTGYVFTWADGDSLTISCQVVLDDGGRLDLELTING